MRKPPLPALRNSAGAFDLPSIITGVVVVGILAAGVLAAIFGVIPFAQDRGAKQDLSSIRTAEGVAKAKDNRFMDHKRLLDIGYLQLSSTEKTKVKADAKGTCYVGIAKSGTGTLFYSTDANTDPQVLEADTDTGCLTEEELAELIDDVGGIDEDVYEDKAPSGAPANLKLTAVSALQAKATWDPVKGATGYMVEYRINAGDWVTLREKGTITSATIAALPEQAVGVRVYTLAGGKASEPASATVTLPDSILKNPGFEQGQTGWQLEGYSAISSEISYAGGNSLAAGSSGASQVLTVPTDAPVLTYWHRGTTKAITSVGATTVPSVSTDITENGWTQYKADLSVYAGKTVTLKFAGSVNSCFIDDVAFESVTAPDSPTGLSGSSRHGTATVGWVAPVFAGGTPVTSYTVTAWTADGTKQDSAVVDGNQRSATLTNVKTGSSHTFTVTATNSVGVSKQSQAYGPIEILPGAVANPGFEYGTTGWLLEVYSTISSSAPHTGKNSLAAGSSGASQVLRVPTDAPVLTYWHRGTAPAKTSVGATAVAVVTTGKTENGWTQYKADLSGYAGKTVTLKFAGAVNSCFIDDVAFESVTAPDSPTGLSGSSRHGTATVGWVAPVFAGGTPVTSYTVTAWTADGTKQDSVVVDGNQRSATLTNVKTGSSHTFTVTATNSVGVSKQSQAYGPIEILPGAVANPGFEYGTTGWLLEGYSTISSSAPHTGRNSLAAGSSGASQVLTVPTDAPVLTYWHRGTAPAKTSVGATTVPSVSTDITENGWTQYKADLSGYAGKTVTLKFAGAVNSCFIDDIAFEAKG